MLINEVTAITGLSKKAIRFYEMKGLLKIERISNGYRKYSNADVEILNKIKLLRMAGVSVSDIKLLFDDVIKIDELLEKRKNEIEKQFGYHSKQFLTCRAMLEQYENQQFNYDTELDEDNMSINSDTGDLAVGIDIGTTTISAVVINLSTKKQVELYTVQNNYNLVSDNPAFCEQDTEGIYDKVFNLTQHIMKNHDCIRSIGVTGQMHGIVYLDREGNAVSHLITWRDKRADLLIDSKNTYCERIFNETDEKISAGYGFATHFYNKHNNLVPAKAYTFCSIMDYVVMKLTKSSAPVIHTSVAASFGFFDVEKSEFKAHKLSKLMINDLQLPEVTDEYFVCGEFNGAKVSVAIGDNQASFLGSVKGLENSILINIGTGSQISAVVDSYITDDSLEIRPLIKDKYIMCGSALCGGASYALLEKFFREFVSKSYSEVAPQYEVMNKLAQEAYNQNKIPLTVNTFFSGKRHFPDATGSILGIRTENFTPGQLILGFIIGMCRELYELFENKVANKKTLVASGNAVQKITIIKDIISNMFNLPVNITLSKEEASVGCALFSSVSAGMLKNTDEFSDFIEYKKGV